MFEMLVASPPPCVVRRESRFPTRIEGVYNRYGGSPMSVTTRIPEDRLAEYFAAFTKKFLLDESPEAVDVEVVEPDWGEQVLAQNAHLIGITYEPKTRRLEFELD